MLLAVTLTSMTWGCGEPVPDEAIAKAPPAGHCETLCNHLDAVNKELRCDMDDSGLGETFEVNVESCISDCEEPKICMDLTVEYDECRIALAAEGFQCNARGGTPPLATDETCIEKFNTALRCVSDNR